MHGTKQLNFNRILSAALLRRAFSRIVSLCSLPFITTCRESLDFPSAGKYSSTVVFLHDSKYNSLTKNFPAVYTIGLSTSRLPAPVMNTPSAGGDVVFASCSEIGASLFDVQSFSAYETKQIADAEHEGSHELAMKLVRVPACKVGKHCKLFVFHKINAASSLKAVGRSHVTAVTL